MAREPDTHVASSRPLAGVRQRKRNPLDQTQGLRPERVEKTRMRAVAEAVTASGCGGLGVRRARGEVRIQAGRP